MRFGTPSDYRPPYSDGPQGSWAAPSPLWEAEISRVVGIGRDALLAWWERVRRDTSPNTFGQTDSEFTASVAYYLASGGPSVSSLEFAKRNYRAAAAILAYRRLADPVPPPHLFPGLHRPWTIWQDDEGFWVVGVRASSLGQTEYHASQGLNTEGEAEYLARIHNAALGARA